MSTPSRLNTQATPLPTINHQIQGHESHHDELFQTRFLEIYKNTSFWANWGFGRIFDLIKQGKPLNLAAVQRLAKADLNSTVSKALATYLQRYPVRQEPNSLFLSAATNSNSSELFPSPSLKIPEVNIPVRNKLDSQAQEALNTRLLEAAQKGLANEVQEALDLGADLDATDKDGGTALNWAIYKGYEALAGKLLQIMEKSPEGMKAVYSIEKSGYTALNGALAKGYEALAGKILQIMEKSPEGMRAVYSIEKNGYTALIGALDKGSEALVCKILQIMENSLEGIKAIQSILVDGSTALNFALDKGYEALAGKILQILEKSPEGMKAVQSIEKSGYTALIGSLGKGYESLAGKIFQIMEKSPEGIKAIQSILVNGVTALNFALDKSYEALAGKIFQIMEKSPEGIKAVHSIEKNGYTALIGSLGKGYESLAGKILQIMEKSPEGIKAVQSIQGNGYTSLHVAIDKGYEDLAVKLIPFMNLKALVARNVRREITSTALYLARRKLETEQNDLRKIAYAKIVNLIEDRIIIRFAYRPDVMELINKKNEVPFAVSCEKFNMVKSSLEEATKNSGGDSTSWSDFTKIIFQYAEQMRVSEAVMAIDKYSFLISQRKNQEIRTLQDALSFIEDFLEKEYSKKN